MRHILLTCTLVACGGLGAGEPAAPGSSGGGEVAQPSHAASPAPAPAAPAEEPSMYHVYRLENGTCEVEMRNHVQFQSARLGNPTCMGHFTSHSSGLELRDKLAREGACKK